MSRPPHLCGALLAIVVVTATAPGCGGGSNSIREGHPPIAVAGYLANYGGLGMRTTCRGIGPPSTVDANVYGIRNDFTWFECRITSLPRPNPYGFFVGQKLDLPDPLVGS